MKHKHYDMIVAKAENMDLVVLIKRGEGCDWRVIHDKWDMPFLAGNNSYSFFLCLPQHKEAVLNQLNGGASQFSTCDGIWIDASHESQFHKWGAEWWYMCDKCESRVKPKKEKRWVVLQYDSELGDWCSEDGTLYKTLDEAEENRRYGQLAEIEVEV